MFSIPYSVVLINIYPSIVTIIHRILTYFRRNISLKHMSFKELRNISNEKAKVHAIFVQVIPPPSAGDNHCILFSKCYSDFDDRFYTLIPLFAIRPIVRLQKLLRALCLHFPVHGCQHLKLKAGKTFLFRSAGFTHRGNVGADKNFRFGQLHFQRLYCAALLSIVNHAAFLMGHKSKGTGERVYTHKTIEELKLNIELITD